MADGHLADLPAQAEDGFEAPDEVTATSGAASKELKPELRLADLLSQGHRVPVPIDQLLQNEADVVDVHLPADLSDVDAVSISHPGGRRSRVLINRAKSMTPRRERFTKAHELGHLVIPWHVGSIGCTTEPGATGGDTWTARREAEANRFAARLLVPQQWLLDLVIPNEPAALFAELDTAGVSALPALLRLVPELPVGWMVSLVGNDAKIWRSPGSLMPAVPPGLSATAGSRGADHHGHSELGGRKVYWWVWDLVDPPYPTLPSLGPLVRRLTTGREEQMKKAGTKLLREALVKTEGSDARYQYFAGVTGAIAGAATLRTPAGLYCAFRQRFSETSTEGEVTQDPLFAAYLASRAWQLSGVAAQ